MPPGDKPELRWPEAKAELISLGFNTTLDYVHHLAREVLLRTGMLPHINAGVMNMEDLMRSVMQAGQDKESMKIRKKRASFRSHRQSYI